MVAAPAGPKRVSPIGFYAAPGLFEFSIGFYPRLGLDVISN